MRRCHLVLLCAHCPATCTCHALYHVASGSSCIFHFACLSPLRGWVFSPFLSSIPLHTEGAPRACVDNLRPVLPCDFVGTAMVS